MSASKKKRLGSQRRPLNPNVQESPETSDKALSQPVAQGRQRADANADITLSPGNAQSETSARKKKLGSQRGNKGNLHNKDVTTVSSNKPIEEVEDSATHSQAPDPVKNDSTDESLERNIKSTFPQSEAAGSDLPLNNASDLSLSTVTKVTSQISDIHSTNKDTPSDLLLNVAQSEKYLTEIASRPTEEGVLREKDQAQQMPGIFEATLPAGVTGESTCSDILIEHEKINIIGSHDHYKHNTEDKAGLTEKPVCQESDKSSLPTAKPRKMGSSRRKKVIDLKELQDQGNETVVQSNISDALETTGLPIVDTTQEVHVSATGMTYKEEHEVEINFAPNINKEKMDMDYLSDVASANLLEVKQFEEPHIENVLVEMKPEGDLIEESKLSDEQLVCLQNKDLSEVSFAEIPPTDDLLSELESDKSPIPELQFTKDETVTELCEPMLSIQPEIPPSTEALVSLDTNEEYNLPNYSVDQAASSSVSVTPGDKSSVPSGDSKNVNIIEQPEPLISFTDGVSFVPGQVHKEDQDKDLNISNEQLVQMDDSFDISLQIPKSADSAPVTPPDDTCLKENTNFDFYAVDQDSDKSSVSRDTSESSSESTSTNDESAEPVVSELHELKPSTEGMLQLDQNKDDVPNISTTTESIGAVKNETEQTEGVHQQTLSSESEASEDETSNSSGSTDDEESTDSSKPDKEEDQEEIKLSHEQLVDLQTDMSSEPEGPSNPHTEEINADLTSPFPDIAASVDDVAAAWDVQDKKSEVITSPDTAIDEIQVEPVLEEQSTENKDYTAEPDITDKAPIQTQNESNDNEDAKYTSKPTDEADIVEIKDTPETLQFLDPEVDNETTGKALENVQNTDVEANASDTDPRQDSVKRKFGSSRRSKPRKYVIEGTTGDSDDALPTENKNLPLSVDHLIDEPSTQTKKEENIGFDDAAVRELSSANEEMELDQMKEKILEVEANILGLDENVSKIVEDAISQPTEVRTSILSEVDEDENQQLENDEMKEQKDENDVAAKETLLKKVEHVQSSEIGMSSENQPAIEDKPDTSFKQAHDEALETGEDLKTNYEFLKPAEVTALLEADQTADDLKDNQVLDNVILEQTTVDSQETSTEPKNNSEQSDISTESYALKETINVHQLTYISDSDTHEEMDNFSFQQTEQPVLEQTVEEPSESVKLIDAGVNKSDSDSQHGPRRKLGSSRRIKGRKLESIPTDSKDTLPNDDENAIQVPETVEASVGEKISTDFVSELEAEQINQDNFAKPEDTELFLTDKETADSPQEKEIETQVVSFEEKTIIDIQKEIPEVAVDSFTIKDLKDKGVVEEEGLPRDVDYSSLQSVAGSEDIISGKLDDAMQPVVMSVEGITKEEESIQVMEVSETSAKVQVDSESKRRKMGSTRRSELNRKQQDEERNAEDNAAISVKATINEKDNSVSVSEEDAQPLSSDLLVNQGESTTAAGHVKDEHQSEESTERPEVAQEDKEKILQTEAELVVDINEGASTQTLLPIAGEEIQPPSPGKRRKMGSTRKNLSSKRENLQEETVTPVISEREAVASISNDNDESKKHSDLLAHTATVHQPPPDEETPLSQQVSQEKSNLESKEAELSSQHEAMAEDAVIARRRKMGSHRKPHSDQSVMERRVKDSEESLLHPLREHRAESPKLTQLSELNEGDNKASSSTTAFNIKPNSRPQSEKISEQPPVPSINVRRAQQSSIRISTGFDRSASRYEVVMIGDSSVGKTSFIQRAQSGKFSADVPASIGMDSYKWTVVVNGKTVVLHLWDTAGQERFRSMTKQIFHRAQAFLLMYDVTCAQTFTAVSYWANCIKDGAAENAVVLLLGNKSDRTERKVRREEGEILAEENNFTFMECSAATGENVIEALETVARLLSQKADRSEEPLLLRKPEPKNKPGCC